MFLGGKSKFKTQMEAIKTCKLNPPKLQFIQLTTVSHYVCPVAQRKAPDLLPASSCVIFLYNLAQDIFYKVEIIDELR